MSDDDVTVGAGAKANPLGGRTRSKSPKSLEEAKRLITLIDNEVAALEGKVDKLDTLKEKYNKLDDFSKKLLAERDDLAQNSLSASQKNEELRQKLADDTALWQLELQKLQSQLDAAKSSGGVDGSSTAALSYTETINDSKIEALEIAISRRQGRQVSSVGGAT
jgi:DNA repair exonuclease SbcCD ATPase subunit